MSIDSLRPEIIIVGGGIAGCATAYYLARAGMQVLVLDKGDIGYEQSTRNWGWVHQQVRYPHLIGLGMRSVALWQGLERELGAALEWRQGGNATLARDAAELAELEDIAAHAQAVGLDATMVDRGVLETRLPGLGNAVVGGLWVPSDGQANPALVTAAFATAAGGLGAEFRSQCAVYGIETDGGRATGVRTEQGVVRAPRVLLAAGAWTARLLRPLRVRFPQRSVRATVVRTEPAPPCTAATGWGDAFAFRQDAAGRFVLAGGIASVIDVDLDTLRHFREFAPIAWQNRRSLKVRIGRRLWKDVLGALPGTNERAAYWQRRRAVDPEPLPGVAEHTLGKLHEAFPELPPLAIEARWAGYIDSTPDQAPAIGPVPGVEALHVLSGLSGHGFALGPAAAELQAALILGDSPEVDTKPFRFERFAERDLPILRAPRR